MQAIGLIKELQPSARVELPTLADLRGKLPETVVARVVQYLGMGIDVSDAMGVSWDPLDPKFGMPGGFGLVSDGLWVWRKDLAHFVKRYAIALDEAFVRHVLSGVQQTALASEEALLSRANEVQEAFDRACGW